MSPPHDHQLTCREFLDLLLQFVENEGGQIAALGERHLELCRACRDYLASYQETRRLSRAAAADEAGPTEDLLEQILAAAGSPLH